MSVTFYVANSPRHTITRTYGDETVTSEEDVLPTCNFSNGNAVHILRLCLISEGYGELVGEIPTSEFDVTIEFIRRAVQGDYLDDDDKSRLFALHTVLHAASQFGQPVRYT